MLHAQSQVEAEVTDAKARVLSPEDELRAQHYRLLAHFLTAAPHARDLQMAAALSADEATTLGRAVNALADAAGKTDEVAEGDAYQELFIGLGRGILVPYGSYYLTGFLHEKPLARLRVEMSELGIQRNDGVKEPEDHISSILEMMAGLIAGDFGDIPQERQRSFFAAHVNTWAGHFFRDLSLDTTSNFYAALGTLGGVFLEVEEHALRLD